MSLRDSWPPPDPRDRQYEAEDARYLVEGPLENDEGEEPGNGDAPRKERTQ